MTKDVCSVKENCASVKAMLGKTAMFASSESSFSITVVMVFVGRTEQGVLSYTGRNLMGIGRHVQLLAQYHIPSRNTSIPASQYSSIVRAVI